jgi:hypothetical protein
MSFLLGRDERKEAQSGVAKGPFRGTPPKEKNRAVCKSWSRCWPVRLVEINSRRTTAQDVSWNCYEKRTDRCWPDHGWTEHWSDHYGKTQARPANSRFSVDTFTFSPSLMNRGTRISRPVSSRAGLVTVPPDESPRTPGSVDVTFSSTKMGSSKPIGLPLYLCN